MERVWYVEDGNPWRVGEKKNAELPIEDVCI